MLSTDSTSLVQVEQVDREAAAALYLAHTAYPDAARSLIFVTGNMDDHDFVQAFARHRLEALRTQGDGEGWQSMESVPLDGTQFLALLSNGWYDLLSSPGKIDADDRFRWWMGRHNPPIESTHTETDWGNTLRAVAWRHLPAAPTQASSREEGE